MGEALFSHLFSGTSRKKVSHKGKRVSHKEKRVSHKVKSIDNIVKVLRIIVLQSSMVVFQPCQPRHGLPSNPIERDKGLD